MASGHDDDDDTVRVLHQYQKPAPVFAYVEHNTVVVQKTDGRIALSYAIRKPSLVQALFPYWEFYHIPADPFPFTRSDRAFGAISF
jgi:hypothetical protein